MSTRGIQNGKSVPKRSRNHPRSLLLPDSPLASSDETLEMIAIKPQGEQKTFSDASPATMGATALEFSSAAPRSSSFVAAWARATTRAFGGESSSDKVTIFQTPKTSSDGGQKMTVPQTTISPPLQSLYDPYSWTSGDADPDAFVSYNPYAPVGNEHNNPMFNPEHLDASTTHTGSLTGLTTNLEMRDASRQHLDHSDWTGGNPGAGITDFFPPLDQSDLANPSFVYDGSPDQGHNAAIHGMFCGGDLHAQQFLVETLEMPREVMEAVSSPSSHPNLTYAPGSKNVCNSLPFMEHAHEETVGVAPGNRCRKREESFGREVGLQKQLATGWDVEQPSFGLDLFQPCWMPGQHLGTNGVTQPAQAGVEMNPPLAGEMEGAASLQPEEGGSGGDTEVADPYKRIRNSASHNEQEKNRRGEIKENLEALKPLFTAAVLARYNKYTQLEHILGARDTIVETKSNLTKALDSIKALEGQVAALSSCQSPFPHPFAHQPSPFHNGGMGYPGMPNLYPHHSEQQGGAHTGGMGYPGLANQYPHQSEQQEGSHLPPLTMSQRGRMTPCRHHKLQARMPSQLQMQPQPMMQFQEPAPMPSQPQMPSQLQMQPQPPMQFHGTAPMPSQPQMPAYAQAQMQPHVMHQLAVPQAAYQPDDMTFSGMGGQMRHGRGEVVAHTRVHTQQELWGGEGAENQMRSIGGAQMIEGVPMWRRTADNAPSLSPLPITSAPVSLHHSLPGGRMRKSSWGKF